MILYIISSDKSIHSIEAMQYYINKNWKPNPTVKVLGYSLPKHFKLASNFELISMGEDKGPDHVTSKIYEYMSNIKDEQFIFTVDDFLPIEEVNVDHIEYLKTKVKEGNISRISLDTDFGTKNAHVIDKIDDTEILQLHSDISYPGKVSAVWAIWNKEDFLSSIKDIPSLHAWERASRVTQNVLGTKKGLIKSCHLFKHAQLRNNWTTIVDRSEQISSDDINKIQGFLDKWKSEGVIQL